MKTAALLAALLTLALVARADNLIVNPGFEQIAGDLPEGWQVFVLPQESALGRVDARAHVGKYAVLLHTALPYAHDPSNNWSQNLRGAYGGKTFRLSGWVRSEEVSGAALWLQCWKQNPLRLLSTGSTSPTTAISGTHDWQEIATTASVPPGTDFITVRCVLQGVGSVWFDDLSLTEVGDAASATRAPIKPAAKLPIPQASNEPLRNALGPAPKAQDAKPGSATPSKAEHTTLKPVSPPPDPAMNPGGLDHMSHELNAVRDANEYLGQTVDDLRSENQHLLDELDMVHQEVKSLNEKVSGAAPKPQHVPPLVPHGEDWRKQP